MLNTLDTPVEDRLALYELHLRNTLEGGAPNGYATLLQLRTLLDLSLDDAEQVETEVACAGCAYSI